MESNLSQRLLGIGELLKFSWTIFKDRWKVLLVIVLVVYLPINVILSFFPVQSPSDFRVVMSAARLLEGLVGIIALSAIILVVKERLEGKALEAFPALKKGVQLWPKMFGTNVLLGFFIICLALLLVLPALVYGVFWTFTAYVVVIKGISGKKALDYSKEMVAGRWWTVFKYGLVIGVVGFVVGLITGGVLGWVPLSYQVMTILTDTAVDFIVSYFLVVGTVMFLNFDAVRQINQVSSTELKS